MIMQLEYTSKDNNNNSVTKQMYNSQLLPPPSLNLFTFNLSGARKIISLLLHFCKEQSVVQFNKSCAVTDN